MSTIHERIREIIMQGNSVTFTPKFDPDTLQIDGSSFRIVVGQPVTFKGDEFIVMRGPAVANEPLATFWVSYPATVNKLLDSLCEDLGKSRQQLLQVPPERAAYMPDRLYCPQCEIEMPVRYNAAKRECYCSNCGLKH